MLTNYLKRVKEQMPHMKKVALLSKKHHLKFYEKAGFEVVGESPVDHGSETWYDCIMNLK